MHMYIYICNNKSLSKLFTNIKLTTPLKDYHGHKGYSNTLYIYTIMFLWRNDINI